MNRFRYNSSQQEYKNPKKRFVDTMKYMKYRFYVFHVNTNIISLTSISNKCLKLINTKGVNKKTCYLRRNNTTIK